LVDQTLDGKIRKAVIVPTKRAELFVLDRETGEPITLVEERAVPQSDLLGERTTPTQPFSVGMPSFAYPGVVEADLFGITPFDQMACRSRFLKLRNEGLMTPPSVEGTLLYPGPAGGMNWGSVAVDEQRQLMVVNALQMAWVIHMIPREEDRPTSENQAFASGYGIGGPQRGTAFAARVELFTSPFELPCLKPPYGEIAVVDLTTQQIVWRRGMGTLGLGFPSTAGSFVTAGGLIFNGGVTDGQMRAIDVNTGDVLWTDKLRTSSQATPMSYVSSKSGRQYVLVTVPGGELSIDENPVPIGLDDGHLQVGGRVIAYALPEGVALNR
jgi:quinoprotein glucose dehydrogenase